jgi:hypothetical protein
MRVQVRVEGAGGVMGEFRGDEIPCQPLASCATNADTSCRESLDVLQRYLHSPRMGFNNPLVIAKEAVSETDFGAEKVKS